METMGDTGWTRMEHSHAHLLVPPSTEFLFFFNVYKGMDHVMDGTIQN